MPEYEHLSVGFAPVYDDKSRILILGSFPSRASRSSGFYYGHPRNRFWPLLARLCRDRLPEGTPEKISFLRRHQIALWDVIAAFDIIGSSDSSVRNAVPNDIPRLLAHTHIGRVYTDGALAGKLLRRYYPDLPFGALPSTSPANAAYSLERLAAAWKALAD